MIDLTLNIIIVKLLMMTEIKKLFKKRGFKIVKLSKFSFFEQISIFKNCNLLLDHMELEFFNLIFCKRKTKVLEIKYFLSSKYRL